MYTLFVQCRVQGASQPTAYTDSVPRWDWGYWKVNKHTTLKAERSQRYNSL